MASVVELAEINTIPSHCPISNQTQPQTCTRSPSSIHEQALYQPNTLLSQPSASTTSFTAYPDGGFRAYTVLFGTWCALLPTSGMLTTTGSLQTHLLTHQLKNHSEAEVGWIFSVFAFLFFFGGIFGGELHFLSTPSSFPLQFSQNQFKTSMFDTDGTTWSKARFLTGMA